MNSRDVIPTVEVRKPFSVYRKAGHGDTWGVICEGSKPPLFPNTHGNTLLVTFPDETEATKLADSLNEAFADHFDV